MQAMWNKNSAKLKDFVSKNQHVYGSSVSETEIFRLKTSKDQGVQPKSI